MSSQDDNATAVGEHGYYQEVEQFFTSRRGDPLFLSNADWLLVHKWRQAGTPLRIVLRGIADALDAHAHSWSRDRKVGSLAYCAAEVEAARQRWQRALAMDVEDGLGAQTALFRFADGLESVQGLQGRAAQVARDASAALRLRAEDGEAGLAGLESWLQQLERELLEALKAQMGQELVAPVEAQVEADLAPYAARMPARVLAQVRADSLARRILEAYGLPRLSLFHL